MYLVSKESNRKCRSSDLKKLAYANGRWPDNRQDQAFIKFEHEYRVSYRGGDGGDLSPS